MIFSKVVRKFQIAKRVDLTRKTFHHFMKRAFNSPTIAVQLASRHRRRRLLRQVRQQHDFRFAIASLLRLPLKSFIPATTPELRHADAVESDAVDEYGIAPVRRRSSAQGRWVCRRPLWGKHRLHPDQQKTRLLEMLSYQFQNNLRIPDALHKICAFKALGLWGRHAKDLRNSVRRYSLEHRSYWCVCKHVLLP
jgi:hypothetical protein